MFYEVTDLCAGCMMCLKRCPANAIRGERRQQHFIDPSLCKACGACWRQCPKGAILDPQGRRRRGKPVKELPQAQIAPESCAGCRTCQLLCPFEAIRFVPRRFPLVGVGTPGVCRVDPARCYGCGTCVAVCPTGAATISEPREDVAVRKAGP